MIEVVETIAQSLAWLAVGLTASFGGVTWVRNTLRDGGRR